MLALPEVPSIGTGWNCPRGGEKRLLCLEMVDELLKLCALEQMRTRIALLSNAKFVKNCQPFCANITLCLIQPVA